MDYHRHFERLANVIEEAEDGDEQWLASSSRRISFFHVLSLPGCYAHCLMSCRSANGPFGIEVQGQFPLCTSWSVAVLHLLRLTCLSL